MIKKTFKRDAGEVNSYTRTMKIETRVDNDGKKRYMASLSSEYAVKRYNYTEILKHSRDAINLERTANGIVLLFNQLRQKQSEDTQRLERALQVATTEIERLTERLVECEKEMAWLKTAMAKQESRIDAAGKYVKSLKIPVDSGNGTH